MTRPANTGETVTPEHKTKQNGGKWRIAGAIVPAAAITAGLFITMHTLVAVDEVDLADVVDRPLTTITPQKKDINITRTERVPPQRIDVAKAPPPPPEYRVGKEDLNLPIIDIVGKAPDFDRTDLIDIRPPGPIGIDRDLIAIRPPTASYPSREQSRGIEGTCEVTFDLSIRGNPFNVTATCSSGGFEREAVRAVSKAEFAPKVREGQPVEAYGLVYPLEFRLQ